MTAPNGAHRPTIAVTRHAIAAGHCLAAAAGFDILQAGGNAVDAGVAAGIALGVTQSDLVNCAGVAPILIYVAEKREVVTIAGLGTWPKALDPEFFMREHGGKIPVGVLRTIVPAAPDAWITALRRYGTMSFGDVAAARDAFYRGDIARKIVAFMKEQGGLLSAEDLAEYRSPVGPAESRRFGDLEVFTCGAWCQGPVLLQTLALLEGTDLKALGHNSADYVHQLTEALKLAFADREAYYTDPATGQVPLPTLISPEYAAERRKMIDPQKAWPEMPPAGDLGASIGFGALRESQPNPFPEPDTSYVCVADRWGNLFSATPSDGSYGSPIVPGTG